MMCDCLSLVKHAALSAVEQATAVLAQTEKGVCMIDEPAVVAVNVCLDEPWFILCSIWATYQAKVSIACIAVNMHLARLHASVHHQAIHHN